MTVRNYVPKDKGKAVVHALTGLGQPMDKAQGLW